MRQVRTRASDGISPGIAQVHAGASEGKHKSPARLAAEHRAEQRIVLKRRLNEIAWLRVNVNKLNARADELEAWVRKALSGLASPARE